MSCPDCFKGSQHTHGTPTGSWSTIHNVRTYVTPAPSSSATSSTPPHTILFICDAFGPALVNNPLLADQYASRTGHRVLVPDFLGSAWAPVSVMAAMETLTTPGTAPWLSLATASNLAQKFGGLLTVIRHFVPFLLIHHPKKEYEPVLKYARAVKAEIGPKGGKLGVAGFCWGGWGSTNLCTEAAVANTDAADNKNEEPLISASFTAHPSALSPPDKMIVDAVTSRNVPYCLAIGDTDMVLSKTKVEEAEAKLRQAAGSGDGQTGPKWQVKIFEGGVKHGFAVRAAEDDAVGMAASKQAEDMAVDWFKRFLV